MPVYNIQVTVDSKGAVTGLKRVEVGADRAGKKMSAAEKRAAALRARLRNLARSASLVGGAMVAMIARSAIRNAQEQEKVMALVENQIRATGGAAGLTGKQVFAMASDIQKATGIGDESILASSAVLLSFKQIAGDVFERTQKLAVDMAQVMQTDTKSATLQLAKALADPVARLGELSRAGIVFSQSQKDVIKEMVAVGDLAKAQNYILAEIESQYGGAAAAARDTLGGALQALGSEWGDLLEMFVLETGGGGILRTAIEGWVTALMWLKDNFARIVGAIEVAWNGLLLIIVGTAEKAVAASRMMAEGLAKIFPSYSVVAKGLRDTEKDLASLFEVAQEGAAKGALKMYGFTSATESAKPPVVALGAGLEKTGKSTKKVGKELGALQAMSVKLVGGWPVMTRGFLESVKASKSLASGLGAVEAMSVKLIGGFPVMTRALEDYTEQANKAAEASRNLTNEQAQSIELGPSGFPVMTRGFGETDPSKAKEMGDAFGDIWAGAVANALGDALTQLFSGGEVDWEQIGGSIGTAIGTAVGSAYGPIAGAALGSVGGALGSMIGGLFSDKEAEEQAKKAAEAFQKLHDTIRSSMPAIRKEVIDTFETILEMLRLVGEAGQSTGEEMAAIQRELQSTVDSITGVSTADFADRLRAAQEFNDTLLRMPQDIQDAFAQIDIAGLADSLVLEFQGITTHLDLAAAQRDAKNLGDAIRAMGLSSEQTARLLKEVARAEKLRIAELKAGALDKLVGVLERAGISSERAARLRAEIEQKIFLINLKKLEAELKLLQLFDNTMRKLINDVASWARDVGNFLPSSGGISDTGTIPVPRSRGGGGSRKQKRKSLRETLEGFINSGRMNDLNHQMDQLRKQFFGKGGFLEQAKKLKVPIKKVTEAFAAAVKQLREQALAGVQSLLDRIKGGALGGLSLRERFSQARQRYESVLSRARGGDLNALRDLPAAAQEFLGLARELFGSGSAYQEVLDGVQSALEGLIREDELTKTDAQRNAEQISGAVESQTEILAELGDSQKRKLKDVDDRLRGHGRLLEDIRDELRRSA